MGVRAIALPLLMIIRYLYVGRAGVIFRPLKTDTPLLVYSYAVLTIAVATQSLEAVAWQHHQSFLSRRGVQNFQTLFSLPGEGLKFSDGLSVSKSPRSLISVADDHSSNYSRITHDVKRNISDFLVITGGGKIEKPDFRIFKKHMGV